LAVLEAFEERRGAGFIDLPQLAATLAAAQSRVEAPPAHPSGHVAARGIHVLRTEGLRAFVRRVDGRIRRTLRAG
jgi:hypothetical protein